MMARERAEKVADEWFGSDVFLKGGAYRKGLAASVERALLDTIEEFRTECMCLHAKLMGRLDLKGDQQFLSGEISALNKYAAEIRKMGER